MYNVDSSTCKCDYMYVDHSVVRSVDKILFFISRLIASYVEKNSTFML